LKQRLIHAAFRLRRSLVRRRSAPTAAQFGVKSSVKLRKRSTALARGLEAHGGTAADFGKFIDDETRNWSEVIRGAGLKG
jgi:hypothetical protein